MFACDSYAIKSEGNVKRIMEKIKEANLLPQLDGSSANRGLFNPFRNIVANNAQIHDLLSFRNIRQKQFESRIESFLIKIPSTKAPLRQKKLQTFASTTVKKQKCPTYSLNCNWCKNVCAKRLRMPRREAHHQMSLQSNTSSCQEHSVMWSQLLSEDKRAPSLNSTRNDTKTQI